jgi:hypothetical protein
MATEIESNGSIGTANLLTANAQMAGQSSSYSDYDYFKLYNSGAGTSQFNVTLPNNYSSYYIKIYDSTGTLQKSYTAYNGSQSYSIPSTSAGYSYISVNSSSTDDYSINANFIADKTGNTPSYQLIANLNSVNEGSTATFNLTTTNVTSGSSVPYNLSGISAADVSGGSLTGNAVVNSSGVATISVTLLNDSLTEGAETLTVTAGGTTASSQINDTSQTPSTFIQQVNVENANTYWSYWYVNPTNWSNWGSPRITLTSELTGNTPLKITAAGSINTDPYVHTDDGQLHPGITNAAGIYVAGSSNGYNPGTTTRVPLNLPNGTLLNTSASWGALLIGNPEIGWTSVFNANSGNGLGSTNPSTNLSISTSLNTLIGRTLPLGTVLFLTYNDQDNSNTGSYTVSLFDTTNNPALYLVSSTASVNEGSTATFTLTTTNVTSGTSVPYTLSGISAADVSGGLLSGNAIVNSSGVATILVTLLNDSLEEGAETLTITAGGATTSTLVNDTSKGIATYSLSASSASVNEGSTASFTLTTTNIASGSSVPYTLSGVSAADITGGLLTGSFVVNSSGVATISVGIVADGLTEGSETLTVTAQGKTASVMIPDGKGSGTPTYSLSAPIPSVDEGSIATFNLLTTNVTAGTSISYTIGGVSAADITGGLTGTATVGTNGIATIFVAVAADFLTEGAETLTVTAQGKSASMVINDTSKSNVSYALSAGSTSYNEGNTFFFTLTTNNVASGTSVPYTLSGSINAADISGGALSGNVIVNGGVGYINVSLLNDNLAEDPETLTVTAGGASVSTVINDTSKGTPTYSISTASASVDEGSIGVFTITASNFTGGGLSIPYTISGIKSADVSDGALSGVAFVSANGTTSGTATISIPILADLTTEGSETLTLTAQGKSASMVINDTSKTPVVVPVVKGTSAKDSITNLPVSQNIDAGAGTDTLVYNSNSYEVVISKSGASTKLTNPVTGEEDTLTNVERIKFADTAIALDTSGVGGQAYRIYQAAFNRTPDDVGLGYWISGMDSGASLASVASGFVSSDEFKALYGASPTNAQIVTKFYENVLHRAPEFEGYNYWLGMLNSGLSVSNALAAFSESPENVSGVSGAISSGIRYTPYVSPTYSMFANATSVNEGGVATFTLRTTNVAAGSSIPYTLSGISAADVTGGALSGTAIVSMNLIYGNTATISVPLLNDLLTEGRETLQVTAGGASASTVVNDTSITLVGTVSGPNTGGSGFGVGGGGGGGGGGG